MMHWFGRSKWAPMCDDCPHTRTPIGVPCRHCKEPIERDDDGVAMEHYDGGEVLMLNPYHYECHLRMITGGLNHLRKTCSCCGGADDPDPPEMTVREAAKAAVTFWEKNRT